MGVYGRTFHLPVEKTATQTIRCFVNLESIVFTLLHSLYLQLRLSEKQEFIKSNQRTIMTVACCEFPVTR